MEAVRERLRACDWAGLADDERVFTASPEALVRHAPIIPELMALDEEIVRNSVRFRWQEVRRDLRATLDADAVLGRTDRLAPDARLFPGAVRRCSSLPVDDQLPYCQFSQPTTIDRGPAWWNRECELK